MKSLFLLLLLIFTSAVIIIATLLSVGVVEASVLPVYVAEPLKKLTESLFVNPTAKPDSEPVRLTSINDIALFWKDTIGTAMIDTLRPRSTFPTEDFFKSKSFSVPLPIGFTPVCLAVSVKLNEALFNQTRTNEDLLEPISFNQLAAWLTGNNSILTDSGEFQHALLKNDVKELALSKTSGAGAVVLDALRQNALYFPPHNLTKMTSGFPTEITTGRSDVLKFYDTDEQVEAVLLDPASSTTGLKTNELAFGFLLSASSAVMNRPQNGIRCFPIRTSTKTVVNASSSFSAFSSASSFAMSSSLLDVVFYKNKDGQIDLPFVARKKFSSSASAASASSSSSTVLQTANENLYPFVAILTMMLDSRTFKCGDRGVGLQDLFFNISFLDYKLATTFSSGRSSSSSMNSSSWSSAAETNNNEWYLDAHTFTNSQGEVKNWPFLLFDVKTRNQIRKILHQDFNAFISCPLSSYSSSSAAVTSNRAISAVSLAKSSSDTIEMFSSLAEDFLLDSLQQHPSLRGVEFLSFSGDSSSSSLKLQQKQNLFQQPGLVIFEEVTGPKKVTKIVTSNGTSSPSTMISGTDDDIISSSLSFGSVYSSLPSFVSPLTSPSMSLSDSQQLASASSLNSSSSSTTSSTFSLPISASASCVAYNPQNLPSKLKIPICTLLDIISSSSSSSSSSSGIRWNDTRIHDNNFMPSSMSYSLPETKITFLGVYRNSYSDSSFSTLRAGSKFPVAAQKHCSTSTSTSSSTSSFTSFSSASNSMNQNSSSILLVNDADLVSTLVSTGGAMTILPCSRVLALEHLGLVNFAQVIGFDGVSVIESIAANPSEFTSLIGNSNNNNLRKRRKNNNHMNEVLGVNKNLLLNNLNSSYLVGAVLEEALGSAAPSFFSITSAWVTSSSSAAASSSSTSTSSSSTSSENCDQVLLSYRFLEWITTSGFGIEATSLSSEILTNIVDSSSALPLLISAQAQFSSAFFDLDFLSSVYSSSSTSSASSTSSSNSFLLPSQVFTQLSCGGTNYQQLSPVPGEQDPATSLAFKLLMPLSCILALLFFIGLYFFLRKKESDDTEFAPVDGRKPIVMICVHVPLKEHVRKLVGTADLELWLELYRALVRYCAKKSGVYLIKEGENCGFFLASRHAETALEFAFLLQEQLLDACRYAMERYSVKQRSSCAFLCQNIRNSTERCCAKVSTTICSSAASGSSSSSSSSTSALLLPSEIYDVTDKMVSKIKRAYQDLQGPFSRAIAHPAALRRGINDEDEEESFNDLNNVPTSPIHRSNSTEGGQRGGGFEDQQQQQEQPEDSGTYFKNAKGIEIPPDQVEDKMWQGLLVSVGIDRGLVDVHYGNDSTGFDYSGVPVEHADSLALVAAAGQTLVSESVLDEVGRIFDLKRIGRIVPVGDMDLGVPIPVKDEEEEAAEKLEETKKNAGVSEKVLVKDFRALMRGVVEKENSSSNNLKGQQQQQQQATAAAAAAAASGTTSKSATAGKTPTKSSVDSNKKKKKTKEEEEQERIQKANDEALLKSDHFKSGFHAFSSGPLNSNTPTPTTSVSGFGVGDGDSLASSSSKGKSEGATTPGEGEKEGDNEKNKKQRRSTTAPAPASASRPSFILTTIAGGEDEKDGDWGTPPNAASGASTRRQTVTSIHGSEKDKKDGEDEGEDDDNAGKKVTSENKKFSQSGISFEIPSSPREAFPEPTSSSTSEGKQEGEIDEKEKDEKEKEKKDEPPLKHFSLLNIDAQMAFSGTGDIFGEKTESEVFDNSQSNSRSESGRQQQKEAEYSKSKNSSNNNSNSRISHQGGGGGGGGDSPAPIPLGRAGSRMNLINLNPENLLLDDIPSVETPMDFSIHNSSSGTFSQSASMNAESAARAAAGGGGGGGGGLPFRRSISGSSERNQKEAEQEEQERKKKQQQQELEQQRKQEQHHHDQQFRSQLDTNLSSTNRNRLLPKPRRFEKKLVAVYSVLPVSLKYRLFPPPRNIKDAKDRTLTEPISKLLSELLYQQDVDALARHGHPEFRKYMDARQQQKEQEKSTGDAASPKSKIHRFHYEIVEDFSPAASFRQVRRLEADVDDPSSPSANANNNNTINQNNNTSNSRALVISSSSSSSSNQPRREDSFRVVNNSPLKKQNQQQQQQKHNNNQEQKQQEEGGGKQQEQSNRPILEPGVRYNVERERPAWMLQKHLEAALKTKQARIDKGAPTSSLTGIGRDLIHVPDGSVVTRVPSHPHHNQHHQQNQQQQHQNTQFGQQQDQLNMYNNNHQNYNNSNNNNDDEDFHNSRQLQLQLQLQRLQQQRQKEQQQEEGEEGELDNNNNNNARQIQHQSWPQKSPERLQKEKEEEEERKKTVFDSDYYRNRLNPYKKALDIHKRPAWGAPSAVAASAVTPPRVSRSPSASVPSSNVNTGRVDAVSAWGTRARTTPQNTQARRF